MYSPSRYRPSRYPAGYAGAGSYGGGGSTNGYSGGGGYSNGYSHSHHHHHDSSSYMTSRAPTSHGPGYTSPYLSDRQVTPEITRVIENRAANDAPYLKKIPSFANRILKA